MLDIDIDISGLKDMEAALLAIGKDIGSKKATGILTSALRDGAKEYQAEMVKNAPVSKFPRIVKTKSGSRVEILPGFLKSRIKIKSSTNGRGLVTRKFGKNVTSVVKTGVFRVPYIVQVEFGTRKVKENPFIRNAFNSKSHAAVSVINQRLAKRISLAQKRIARSKAT